MDDSELAAQRLHDERMVYARFWRKYALGSMTCPSCLLCGAPVAKEQRAIQHAELPDIFICACCVEKVRAPLTEVATKMTVVEVLGHPDKPVSARCCISGCQDLRGNQGG